MTAQTEISRFVAFYRSELARTGFKPDATSTRQSRINFLQATVKRFCSPLLAMKRADSGRPISDEVVVYLQPGPEYRTFSDFLISGGTSAWRLSDHLDGTLEVAQPLVNPLTLGLLPEGIFAPTAAGCVPPAPVPPPTPPAVHPYPDEATYWKAFQDRVRQTYGAFDRAFPDPNDPDAFRRFSRCGYDIRDGLAPAAAADKHIAELRAELEQQRAAR